MYVILLRTWTIIFLSKLDKTSVPNIIKSIKKHEKSSKFFWKKKSENLMFFDRFDDVWYRVFVQFWEKYYRSFSQQYHIQKMLFFNGLKNIIIISFFVCNTVGNMNDNICLKIEQKLYTKHHKKKEKKSRIFYHGVCVKIEMNVLYRKGGKMTEFWS